MWSLQQWLYTVCEATLLPLLSLVPPLWYVDLLTPFYIGNHLSLILSLPPSIPLSLSLQCGPTPTPDTAAGENLDPGHPQTWNRTHQYKVQLVERIA